MAARPHSVDYSLRLAALTAVADPAGDERRKPSSAARRASAPYAEKTRGYYRTLSATSIGLEMALAVVLPLLLGVWLDRRYGTAPWLMLLCLGFGFAAGIRGVWRYVAAADREAAESERERIDRERAAAESRPPDDDARGDR